MMLNSKSVGDKIAAARKKVNLSQAELAQQVFISAQAVGKWERGESMPDISMLNHLAEILGVDLNYFSENFQLASEKPAQESIRKQSSEVFVGEQEKKSNWDISKLNLVDSDFSGLKNLHEKLNSTSIQRCLFIGSDMSGLFLNNNIVGECDFSNSDISKSHIQSSILGNTIFKNCSLKETEFSKCQIVECDFSGANFTKATVKSSTFLKNKIANARLFSTSFIEMQMKDIIFESTLEDCYFENCSFHGVKFQNATLTNIFFKNNRKFKGVQFRDCKADRITYAFLRNTQADLSGITVLP